jgi:hypothetical protein
MNYTATLPRSDHVFLSVFYKLSKKKSDYLGRYALVQFSGLFTTVLHITSAF